jgi:hypothetical protein
MVVRSWARRLLRRVKRYTGSQHVNVEDPGHDHASSRIAAYRSRIVPRLRAETIHVPKVIPRWVPAAGRVIMARTEKAVHGDIRPDASPQKDARVPAASPGPSHPAGPPGSEAAEADAREPAGSEQPGEAAEGEDPKAESKESKRWEVIIAASIAAAAMTGAVLTYLAIQKESAAVESDRESVVQTVMVQNQNVAAKIQVDADDALAARYRQLMAEAGVLSGLDADQAILARLNAVGFIVSSGVSDYLTGTGATARYDDSAALQGTLAADSTSANLPPDEPALTAKIAAHDYLTSRRIRISIVSLLGIVVLLTIARLSKTKKWRRGLFAAAALGYVVATVAAIVQVA